MLVFFAVCDLRVGEVAAEGESFFGDVGAMDEAEGFGLGVEFVASGDDFQGILGRGGAEVHNGDGNDGDQGENGNGEHNFNDGVAALGALMEGAKV